MTRLPIAAVARSFALAGLVAAAPAALYSSAMAATAGGVTDEIWVIRIPKGAPITIGGYWVISGPDTALGTDSVRGAKVAFAEIESQVKKHQEKLRKDYVWKRKRPRGALKPGEITSAD